MELVNKLRKIVKEKGNGGNYLFIGNPTVYISIKNGTTIQYHSTMLSIENDIVLFFYKSSDDDNIDIPMREKLKFLTNALQAAKAKE